MPTIEATTRSSWATALAGSMGLHGLLWWAVSSAELSSEPLPRTLPLAVYLAPPPAEIPAEPYEPLPPEEILDDSLMPEAPEPEPPEPEPEAPAEPPATVASDSDDDRVTPAETDSRPPRAAPARRDIDWNASIGHAIALIRERERERYRAFGYTVPESEIQGPIGRQPDRSKPWESQRPGDTISTGLDRAQVNDNCYYEVYAPGSLLAEAHRFTNSSLSCKPNAPVGPRNDLFLDARPDYLDLHLAEEAANRVQPAP